MHAYKGRVEHRYIAMEARCRSQADARWAETTLLSWRQSRVCAAVRRPYIDARPRPLCRRAVPQLVGSTLADLRKGRDPKRFSLATTCAVRWRRACCAALNGPQRRIKLSSPLDAAMF